MIKEMMATYNRGRAKPKATTKNAVSGPGALSQRTDGNPSAPVVAAGGDYGDRKSLESQASVTGGLPKETKVKPKIDFDVSRFSERGFEAGTAGAAVGPGPGERTPFNFSLEILLSEGFARTQNPIFLELLNTRNAQMQVEDDNFNL